MKVGIITFSNALNYGAILQTVALRYAIDKLGHKGIIIDYHNKAIDDYYRIKWRSVIGGLKSRPWILPTVMKRAVTEIGRTLRNRKFSRLIEELCRPLPLDVAESDVLVFGSDQIWNGIITGQDTFYYGDISGTKAKKIAYAASLGFGKEEFLNNNKKLLLDFKAIGVREKSLRQSLAEIDIQSELNADPTLLLSQNDWNKVFDFKEEKCGNYIFVYAIRSRTKVLAAARRIARANKCKIIELNSNESFSFESVFSAVGYATPRDFVRLLKNSRAVITDSFHGTVFSIIYNKPFISAMLGNKSDDRIHSLVSTLGLESHFIDLDCIESTMPTPLAATVTEKLVQLKSDSIEFLTRNISK